MLLEACALIRAFTLAPSAPCRLPKSQASRRRLRRQLPSPPLLLSRPLLMPSLQLERLQAEHRRLERSGRVGASGGRRRSEGEAGGVGAR